MFMCARCDQARARYEATGNAAEHWCLCTDCHDLLRPDFAVDNYRRFGSGPPICVFSKKGQLKYMIRNREGLLTRLEFNPPVIVEEVQIANLVRATTQKTFDYIYPPCSPPGPPYCDVLPVGEISSWEPPKGYTVLDGAIIFVTVNRETAVSVTIELIGGP